MPPELRENGSLLNDLEFISEAKAAIALDVSEQTLISWRKHKLGPPFSMIGRKFFYAVPKLKAWVEAGGTAAAATPARRAQKKAARR